MNNDYSTQPSLASRIVASTQPKTPVAPVTPSPKKDSGNFLTHLLPMAGGILGTMLAPETGGLSLLAAGALGGLGGMAGKGIENAAEGQDIGNGLLDSGIENAVGGFGGQVLGKGLQAGAKLLGGAAEKGAASKVASQFGGTITKDEASKLAANSVYDPATVQQMGDITKNVINTHLPKILNENADTLMNSGTATGPGSGMIDLSPYYSGGTAISPGVKLASEANNFGADALKQQNLQKQIDSFVKGIPSNVGEGETIGIKSQAQYPKAIRTLPNGQAQNITPSDALGFSKQLDSIIYGDAANGTKGLLQSNVIDDQRLGAALKSVSDGVKDQLYGPESAIGKVGLSQAQKDAVITDLAPLKDIAPDYYNTKVGQVQSATNIPELRKSFSFDASVGKGANRALNADAYATGPSTTQSDIRNVISPKQVLLNGATKAANGPGAAKALGGAAKVLNNSGVQNALPLLARIGTLGAANLPNMGMTAIDASMQGQPTLGSGQSAGGTMQQPGTPTTFDSATQALLARAAFTGDPGATSFAQTLAPQLQRKQQLEAMLSGLQKSFNAAGGAQGMGGIGSILSSLIPGTAAHTYQSQLGSSAASLAAALGISPEQASALLPQLMQEAPVANQRMDNLNNILGSIVGG